MSWEQAPRPDANLKPHSLANVQQHQLYVRAAAETVPSIITWVVTRRLHTLSSVLSVSSQGDLKTQVTGSGAEGDSNEDQVKNSNSREHQGIKSAVVAQIHSTATARCMEN